MERKLALSRGLGRTLMAWSVASFISGILLYLTAIPRLQGIGVQAVLWGIIDAVIALFTLYRQRDEAPEKLARILLINVGLDVIYQVVGIILIVSMWLDPFAVGNGVGIIIQGAFLFILDLYYYARMKQLVRIESGERIDYE